MLHISDDIKTLHFYDPRSEHESLIRNFAISGDTASFEIEDEYVAQKITFRMMVYGGGKRARLTGAGREMFLEGLLVKKPITKLKANPEKSNKESLKFEAKMMGESFDQAATDAGFRTESWSDCHLAFTGYDASNGKGVLVESAYFKTPDEAKRFFDWSLKGADEVIEQGVKNDLKGKRMGRRAVALFRTNHWRVMWMNAGTVRSFWSSELSVVLEFERQYVSRFREDTKR